ncbi:deoxyribonuclease [Levilactobacillus brevis]|uniref:DNA/RNA non-specific endonuclease n=1 Tax=Levilactobacillus brevis TaxID=1580 RepID=UPI00111F0E97|nr:DNA/RNA non-specific endonuclease [Levilactobacillus brevis]TOY84959.1 deoxyribonuclease [Levilactobacillus brevis]
MSSFASFIGGLSLLIAIILGVLWVVNKIGHRNTNHQGRNALIALVVAFIFIGIGGGGDSTTKTNSDKASMYNSSSDASVTATKHAATTHKPAKHPTAKHKVTPTATATTSRNSQVLKRLVSYTNHESAGPTQDYYWQLGKSHTTGFKHLKSGDYHFASDSQGRAGTARAVLTYGEYADSRGSRQGSPLEPSSWPTTNPKVAISYAFTGRTYHGYLYNRSHSIGDSLLGAKSYTSENNFTTGTRPQNVGADQDGGMRYAEETAEAYWASNPNTSDTIKYETTPLYYHSETIPRGSIVDIKSSDGQINTAVAVINSAEGIKINYNTGSNNAKPIKSTGSQSSQATRTTSSHSYGSSTGSASHKTNAAARSTTHSGTKSGQWTVAAAGMVYVSDSHKYYSRVTNPDNYTYESESAAQSSGATRASRGNQYARP